MAIRKPLVLVDGVITGLPDGDSLPDSGGGSLPLGGSYGQVLTKQSNVDGDADWNDPTGGSGIQNVFIQPNEPAAPGLWIQTDVNGVTDDVMLFLLREES